MRGQGDGSDGGAEEGEVRVGALGGAAGRSLGGEGGVIIIVVVVVVVVLVVFCNFVVLL